jgi:uncharacterized phage infection (PIP) family protein YhgE
MFMIETCELCGKESEDLGKLGCATCRIIWSVSKSRPELLKKCLEESGHASGLMPKEKAEFIILQQDLRKTIASRDALTGELSKADEIISELQEDLKLRDDEIAELKKIISELRDREPECDQDLLNDRTLLELILSNVDAIKKLRRKES